FRERRPAPASAVAKAVYSIRSTSVGFLMRNGSIEFLESVVLGHRSPVLPGEKRGAADACWRELDRWSRTLRSPLSRLRHVPLPPEHEVRRAPPEVGTEP